MVTHKIILQLLTIYMLKSNLPFLKLFLKSYCTSRELSLLENKFVYTKAQSHVIGQEQLCPKIMKKVK